MQRNKEKEVLDKEKELLKEEIEKLKKEKNQESEDARIRLETAKQRSVEERTALQKDFNDAATEGKKAAELIEKKDETIEVNNF